MAAAEYKAATAQTAVCQIYVEHFTRVIALIDFAASRGALTDLLELYPLAFAAIPGVDVGTITHDSARVLAQTGVDEMGLAVHELDWPDHATKPENADEELLRKSQAVVSEDLALQRLTEIRSQLHLFEKALAAHWWASAFPVPAPFTRADKNEGEQP